MSLNIHQNKYDFVISLSQQKPLIMTNNKPDTIDEYVATLPPDVLQLLNKVRSVVNNAVPDGVEAIAYAIPTIKLNGKNLVHFAGFKNHIGFYPAPSGSKAFQDELAGYKQGKGSIQFPLDKPIPYHLIEKIVKFRVEEILAKQKKK